MKIEKDPRAGPDWWKLPFKPDTSPSGKRCAEIARAWHVKHGRLPDRPTEKANEPTAGS